ncbi:MAG: hypothetical protein JNG84_05200, partial [Archangium sp.]|nr:hypothetical protein [Archangium sp.]
MRRMLVFVVGTSVACATLSTPRALLDEAPVCTDFGDFERRAGAMLQTVQPESPEAAQVHQARQACARATLERLLEVREKRGAEAAQGVLDDLAMAFSPPVFSALVRDLASSDDALRGMAALAAATAASNRRQQQRDGAEKKALESWQVEVPASPSMSDELPVEAQLTPCDVADARLALACLAEAVRRDVPTEVVAPRALVASGQAQREVAKLPAAKRLVALARVVKVMEAIGVRDATLEDSLRVACDGAWPEVDAAVGRGEPTRAAQLATPCGGVGARKKAVDALRAAAVTAQLAEAQRAGARGHAAALHRVVAAMFGGPAAEWPTPSGAWDLSRLQCA